MSHKEQDEVRFDDLGISEQVLASLHKNGFVTPTPIQKNVISGALSGKDVVGIAQTGTGKTLAFGIPMLERLIAEKGQGLVMVPTRELAAQVEESLRKVGKPLGLRFSVVIGGVSQKPQVQSLRSKPHIVIATPGRLMDLMEQGLYKLDRVNIITLDEADRMLDVGFLPQIKKILRKAPPHQTMLFSATMPTSIKQLSEAFMNKPMRVEIAPQGTTAEHIAQQLFVVSKHNKMRLLEKLLEDFKDDTTLVFSRTKHGAKKIARGIRHMGHSATEIHGNRSQNQRKLALDGFTKGKFRVMVATDIAARGIDVKDISLVINYDLPDNSEDYVHRIGRTGRAGRSGVAISFATRDQRKEVNAIEKLMRQQLPMVDLPELPPERKVPRHEPGQQGQRGGGRGQRGRSRNNRGGSGRSGNGPSRNAYGKSRGRNRSGRSSGRNSSRRGNR